MKNNDELYLIYDLGVCSCVTDINDIYAEYIHSDYKPLCTKVRYTYGLGKKVLV